MYLPRCFSISCLIFSDETVHTRSAVDKDLRLTLLAGSILITLNTQCIEKHRIFLFLSSFRKSTKETLEKTDKKWHYLSLGT